VLSLPIPLRLLLAAQPLLPTRCSRPCNRVITRLPPDQSGLKGRHNDGGEVTPLQRFGSAANLNPQL
jgi:hypothetical protein